MSTTKINVCLQFWAGDRQRAMQLARFIADLEPTKSKVADFTFVARFDTQHDPETIEYVSKKFDVHLVKTVRQMTGWPAGCNTMALDLFGQAATKFVKKQWQHKAIYLIESDVMPLTRKWLAELSKEFEQARMRRKFILGAWCPFHSPVGHINGNMLVAPDLLHRIPGLENCPPKAGWDAYFAPKFAPHWLKSRIMQNHYEFRSNIPEEILFSKVDGVTEPVVAHGTKDLSAERLVRERLGM
jgi:hypothetical protein